MSPRKASAGLASADSPGKRQARKRELLNGDDESGSPDKLSQPPKRHRAAHNPTPDGDDSPDEPPAPVENGIVVNLDGSNPPEEEASPVIEAMTPSRRKPGRPRGSVNRKTTTPSRSRAGVKWATPTTTRLMGMDTPSRRNLADRSARRKVARNLINRVVGDGVSDDDEDGAADEILAREIYSSDDDDNDELNGAGIGGDKSIAAAAAAAAPAANAEEALVAETPSKRRPGRPRGSGRGGARGGARGGRKRSPTPPRDLPAHELYLFQNKPGAAGKASSSNRLLSSTLELLTHDEYFTLLRNYKDPHADGVRLLRSIHAQSFRQWEFELEQGFTVCLYGYGSKRDLLHDFATELYRHAREEDGDDGNDDEKQERAGSRIVVVNGHVRGGLKEALATMARAVDPTHKLPATTAVAMAQGLHALLAANPAVVLTVVLNSIDAPALRKGGTAGGATSTVNTATGSGGVVAGTAQSILAQLAAHRQVRLACSADTPGFALLWDAGARALLNLALHECTTFASPGPAELDVVDEVHELLGRRARRVGGKDGVVFVLRSLPENAKNLFRLLVTEALVAMEEGDGGGFGGDRDGDRDVDMSGAAEGPVVEYRIMYNKAAEEFICSSEMAFRTLLKEFHDHQIITSRKDPLGTELLCLPFRKDELESILEDLMS